MTDPDSTYGPKAPATHTAVTKKVRKPRPLSAMITPPSQPQRSGSATPSKQLEVTPTSRSSALDAKLSASVPRPAARRSLSTPLGRSLSFRAPRTKDRRWSDGLASGLSTYQEDFQPPDILSRRFYGLNLEMSGPTDDLGGVPSLTTYRDSFQWRSPDRLSPRSPEVSSRNGDSPSSVNGTAARTRLPRPRQLSALTTPTPKHPADGSSESSARTATVTDRSEGRPEEQRTPTSVRRQKSNPGNSVVVSATHVGLAQETPSGKSQRSVVSNGDLSPTVNCDARTVPSSEHSPAPHRLRGLQLRSSKGDNAFVYGSHLGS
ncbi:proline-rich protein 14-like isoform X1 [Pomacea canaliculata]|uniref:proline-rich protein 14-like isoform X1 n=1 Tax=Pomacea canaliculata TaxID=400727 RepID=UPI000D72B1EA|nr:proline-rich protein 14-like isoform X1 [Pomacea canaliculata]